MIRRRIIVWHFNGINIIINNSCEADQCCSHRNISLKPVLRKELVIPAMKPACQLPDNVIVAKNRSL